MRDFNFEGSNASSANIAGVRPLPEQNQPTIVLRNEELRAEELRQDAEPMRPFHAEQDDDEQSSNLPKIAAAALVGILVIGGSLYAYETSTANQQPSVKSVAMNSSAPAKVASTGPAAPAPAPTASETTPTQAPAPTSSVVKRAIAEPAPTSQPEQSASNAPASSSQSSDPAINAPMTLTPENAPPAQQGTQTAMQQPLTAPNVSDANGQPTPEVATNSATAPAATPAPTDQATPQSQPQTVQPQVQPQIQPQLQTPAQ